MYIELLLHYRFGSVHLDAVLSRQAEHGLRVDLDKCQFFKDRVSLCGPEIDRYGLHKTQKKIEPVVNALQPTNVSELRSLLGIVSNMHFLTKPINRTSSIVQIT